MLKIENLSTSYKTIDGDVHVLKDINFEIKDNEIFGIAGESGCGKTTLLNTLYDIVDYPFKEGMVILFPAVNLRIDRTVFNEQERRKEIFIRIWKDS